MATIQLTPWAKVEGVFRVGSQPMAGVPLTINVSTVHSYGNGVPSIFTHHDVTTGPEGRFEFPRVFPGQGRIGRRITLMVDDGATEATSSAMILANLPPGETTRLDLGGVGRAVVGKLRPPEGFQDKVLWNFALINIRANVPPPLHPNMPLGAQVDPEKRDAWWIEWLQTDEGKAWKPTYEAFDKIRSASSYYTASVGADGSFRIDDMPAGDYDLSVRFSQHEAGRLRSFPFSIPAMDGGRSDEPLDLGALPLEDSPRP